tara:strand:- start:5912 stop:6397 length:486 start_codon:yes stop_codon:yes gene_type:complete
MALPSSGQISASQINAEVPGRSATAQAPLSGTSSTPQAGSLVKLYATASPPVNQSAPHAYSEFYGRSFVSLTSFLVGAGIVESGNTACSTLGSSFTYYHDGSGTYPAVGDKVYTNSSGTTPASGGTGTNYAVFAAGPPAPPVRYFRLTGSTGTVQATSTCP